MLTRSSACIAHNNTILTEHTSSASSQASSLASIVLPKITHATAQKLTYTHGQNWIHYIASSPSEYTESSTSAGGLTFLCVARESLGRRIPFGFLVEIKKQFLEQYPAEATDFASLPSYGCAAFNTNLKNLMINFGSTTAGQQDALRNAQTEIDDVRDIMSENIERVLERGERIDTLVDKTNRLGSSARDFRVRSTGLRRRMWWKNIKLMVLLVIVVVFLMYIFVGFGCGLPGKSPFCLCH
jgi:vesicle-associated membrane protein 7